MDSWISKSDSMVVSLIHAFFARRPAPRPSEDATRGSSGLAEEIELQIGRCGVKTPDRIAEVPSRIHRWPAAAPADSAGSGVGGQASLRLGERRLWAGLVQ